MRAARRTSSIATLPSPACVTAMPHCSSSATVMSMLTALSSAISARAPRSLETSSPRASCSGALDSAVGKGSSAQNVLPSPGALRSPTSPPIRLASSRQIDRPRPVPPNRRVVDTSACENGMNRRGCTSGAMPGPVSTTARRIRPGPTRCASMCTSPWSVNLSALVMKLLRIWRTRVGSPVTPAGTSGSSVRVSVRVFAAAIDR